MDTILSYRPSDLLMFSPETYFRQYALFNQDLWPLQLALPLVAGLLLFYALRGGRHQGRGVTLVLAVLWAFVAWGFFLQRYADINLAAPTFAVAFVAEAGLLLAAGLFGGLRFGNDWWVARAPGLALYVFAVVGFPFLAVIDGRPWLQAELFGMAPDPTALGTLGLLLMARGAVRWALMFLPVAWITTTSLTYAAMDYSLGIVTPFAALFALALAVSFSR